MTKLDSAKGEVTHRWPQLLPGGKAVLFTVQDPGGGTSDRTPIVVERLETGERKVLVQGGTYGRYVPTGHVIYYRAGTLMAVPFDLERLEVAGSTSPILEGVMGATGITGGAQFSISDSGSLVYVPGGLSGGESSLVWVDRKGAEQPLAAPPRPYNNPRLSPDGRLLAVETLSPAEIWVYDISRNTLSRLTFEGANSIPIWSPDGKRIAFRAARGGPPSLFWKPADGSGSEERLTTSGVQQSPHSWSPDGKEIAFTDWGSNTEADIWVLPLEGERKPRPFLQTSFNEGGAKFSPDGRWLAYASDESGLYEIYVQPFPGPGGKWQISTDGGTEPWWARNGELFYRNGDQVMVVGTKAQSTFSAGTPQVVFRGPYVASGSPVPNYDVTAPTANDS